MNLRQLEVSQAVMYGGTTKNAARLLGITQLVVSNMVRQLEDRLGFSLFDRIGGRLTRRWRPRSCQKPGACVRQCRRRGGPGRRPAPCPRGHALARRKTVRPPQPSRCPPDLVLSHFAHRRDRRRCLPRTRRDPPCGHRGPLLLQRLHAGQRRCWPRRGR